MLLFDGSTWTGRLSYSQYPDRGTLCATAEDLGGYTNLVMQVTPEVSVRANQSVSGGDFTITHLSVVGDRLLQTVVIHIRTSTVYGGLGRVRLIGLEGCDLLRSRDPIVKYQNVPSSSIVSMLTQLGV